MALLISLAGVGYQLRAPAYAVRVVVTWDQFWSQNLLQTTLAPTGPPVDTTHQPRAPLFAPRITAEWFRSWEQNLVIRLPTSAPFGQDDWPVPRDYERSINLRTWSWNYNLNLIGGDKLPTGEIVYELTPRAYAEPATRTWVWSYNLNLVGKDRMIVGDQVYDLTAKPYAYSNELRIWSWAYNLNLVGQDQLPVGEQRFDPPPIGLPYPVQLRTWLNFTALATIPTAAPFNQEDWPLARGPTPIPQGWTFGLLQTTLTPLPYGKQFYDLAPKGYPEPATRTWAWNYNVNLIGQDQLPSGENVSDLVPRGYPEPATRTWAWNYNLNLVGKDRLPSGEQVYDLTTKPYEYSNVLRIWTWSYNINLIGQDQLPNGVQRYDLAPIGPTYPVQLRTWISSTFLGMLAVRLPFNQSDWPLPGTSPPQLQTWQRSYNLNLIGQDRLPSGKQVTDLWPKGYEYSVQLRSWAQSYSLNLIGKDQLPAGEQSYDLSPRPYPEPATRTWVQWLLFTLRPLPPGKQFFDLAPKDYDRSIQLRSWGTSYNPNLVGQDILPAGAKVSDLSPRGISPSDLRSWINSVNLALVTAAAIQRPFNQYDWQVPKAAQQPIQIWTASYNLNLIGKDILPTGDQFFELTPKAPLSGIDLRTWINSVNLALGGFTTAAPPRNQYDWPLATAWASARVGYRDYSFISGDNLCLGIPSTPIPPPPTPPVGPQFVHNPGNEWQIYDRIREPGPVGWR